MQFKEIRINAFLEWQELSGRKCHAWGDDINDSYECDWQLMNQKHVSIFCSLGVWASCFSQLLQDKRYDDIKICDSSKNEVLSLYYSQVLLIISEILSDLVQMYCQASGVNQGQARSNLSDTNGYELNDIIGFVNRVTKHKADGGNNGSFHHCNHHLPVRFEDCPNTRRNKKSLSVGNIHPMTGKTSVLWPSLNTIVFTIINAYRILDNKFSEDPEAYNRLASIYENA